MLSTRRSRGSGGQALAHLALLLAACTALALFSLAALGRRPGSGNPPSPAHGDGVHPGGGNDGLDTSGGTPWQWPSRRRGRRPAATADNPPPDNPPPARSAARQPAARQPAAGQAAPRQAADRTADGGDTQTVGATATGLSGVAGATASGHSGGGHSSGGAPTGSVIVKPHTNPAAKVAHHKAKATPAKPVTAAPIAPLPVIAAASTGNPNRSSLADRLLSPTQIDLSARQPRQGRTAHPLADRAALSAGDDLQQGDREEPRGDQGLVRSPRGPGSSSSSAGSPSGRIPPSP